MWYLDHSYCGYTQLLDYSMDDLTCVIFYVDSSVNSPFHVFDEGLLCLCGELSVWVLDVIAEQFLKDILVPVFVSASDFSTLHRDLSTTFMFLYSGILPCCTHLKSWSQCKNYICLAWQSENISEFTMMKYFMCLIWVSFWCINPSAASRPTLFFFICYTVLVKFVWNIKTSKRTYDHKRLTLAESEYWSV